MNEYNGVKFELTQISGNRWSLICLADGEVEWPDDETISIWAGVPLEFLCDGDHPEFDEAIMEVDQTKALAAFLALPNGAMPKAIVQDDPDAAYAWAVLRAKQRGHDDYGIKIEIKADRVGWSEWITID